MIGYHFTGPTLRDGRPVPPDGEWLIHDGPVLPCKSGLHASENPFDALQYAPGETLCKVELLDDLVPHDDDKHVGRRRRIIARFDATYLLRRFAADQALSVKHMWTMPEIVEQYLTTIDESFRDAANAAAFAAARNAAWNASWAATWAACAAAGYDAWYGARASVKSDFTARVEEEFSKLAIIPKNETRLLPKGTTNVR